MLTIYKYPLQITDRQTIDLPAGAGLLSVGNQKESLCLWALVDTGVRGMNPRAIAIVGTGHPMDMAEFHNPKFIGTVQFEGGALVFHVFEL